VAKCRLGEKKLAKCRAVTGAPYTCGFARGGWPHFWVECHLPPSPGGYANWDMVNWQTGVWYRAFRDGKPCNQTTPLDGTPSQE
jgi:hypothetical protein